MSFDKRANTTPNAIHSRELFPDFQQDVLFQKGLPVTNAGPQIPTEHFQTDFQHSSIYEFSNDRAFAGRPGHHLLADIHPQRRRAGLSDQKGQALGPHDL